MGQITPRKGQLELVDAFSKAAADMPHAKLLVIGSPIFDHDDVCQQQVFELTSSLGMSDRVVFLGHRNDATDIIKQLDTLVINSKSEAFVMVGIEAMACKTAVMATDVGGTREMIEDGVNGLLIPFGDEAALLSALKKMYADAALRQLFVERSREMVEKELTIERFAGEFHNALFSAAAGKAQASTAIERAVNAVENP